MITKERREHLQQALFKDKADMREYLQDELDILTNRTPLSGDEALVLVGQISMIKKLLAMCGQ